jgi:hypothetical protein
MPRGRLIAALSLAVFIAALFVPRVYATPDAQANRIRVEYVPPTNPEHQKIYEMVKERRSLEKLQEIFGAFRLPADLLLRTVGCDGVSNAWYQRGRVSVCYEYLSEIQKMMPHETTPAGITPADAIMGQFFFVIAHEMGHAMFDMLDVPVLGSSEDAADHFATYIILQFGKEQARRLIGGAAHSYKDFVQNPKVTVPLAAFSNSHSPPPVRFYNMLCLAYGADRTLFADVVTNGYLPRQRADVCRKEYGEVAFAFKTLLGPHLDKSIARQVMQSNWLPEETAKPAQH